MLREIKAHRYRVYSKIEVQRSYPKVLAELRYSLAALKGLGRDARTFAWFNLKREEIPQDDSGEPINYNNGQVLAVVDVMVGRDEIDRLRVDIAGP